MTSDEIRARFLEFFEQRDHSRVRSASLVPAAFDPSVLLTTAGMHPMMPYFLGQERPPHARLTSCQKCFRTPDIDQVGLTARHLTFFEMLGNFSFGDYFKQGAVEFAWELSLEVFGFDRERIWITVFAGDEELGLGPDEEAIEAWLSVGVPRERIVPCPRSENFWQAGPAGPCGPCSELYLDRGVEFGLPEDLPGGDNERFLEYWNLVFMQFKQQPPNTLTALPALNIDTGLGLNRLAVILQDTPTVFETDQFKPLIELGEELSGRRYGSEPAVDRALRVLADHSRGVSFLVADGVVPSNEDRGYVLRRIMRRAIQQGRSLGCAPGFLARYAETVRELMGAEYPELTEQRASIQKWLRDEEENFGRTLEQGLASLQSLIDARSVAAQDIFKLHDTFGFPFELSKELLEQHGLAVDEAGFQELMGAQRVRSRAGGAGSGAGASRELRSQAGTFAAETSFTTRFTGYEHVEQATTVGAVRNQEGKLLVKLGESPFYAAGGGQVSDGGEVGGGVVAEVLRVGDDQVLVIEDGTDLSEGERVLARVDRAARRATECNHTATHLLHAALRARLGPHVRQAGSYVGPDKLRFDFSHSHSLSAAELQDVEDQINAWIIENHPVRPIVTTLDEAKALGAMALFGEKYGEIVRMVQIGEGDFSRELCGGTHVRATAEIGVLRMLSETSSAANVRRIEALTGPAAVALLRAHDRALGEAAGILRAPPEEVAALVREREEQRRQFERAARAAAPPGVDAAALAVLAESIGGVPVVCQPVELADGKQLLDVVDRIKGKLTADGVIVLGGAGDGRVSLVVSVAPSLVPRGLAAGAIVKAAASVVGGGGGGRDTLAQAGGRDPAKLAEALACARGLIAEALTGS